MKDRLRTQWAESVEDWIHQNQAVRTGMLDSWMLESLRDVSGKRVIDIGCGEGRFCRLLAGLGAEVTGIDLTEALVEWAMRLSRICLSSTSASIPVTDPCPRGSKQPFFTQFLHHAADWPL